MIDPAASESCSRSAAPLGFAPLAPVATRSFNGKLTPVAATRLAIPQLVVAVGSAGAHRFRVRVRSYRFTADATRQPPPQATEMRRAAATQQRRVRFQPPKDLVRLADRLHCLLQPSLDLLLDGERLELAHDPYAYQLEGVAFLYPRHAAVLADEMGLGKTMQAINAVRLLVHGREVERCLLVCPKPLVANWRREFAAWAPELPVGVVDGPPARREWLWRSASTPVLLANYETVVRDAECVAELPPFDLVVLDESQRIKNPRGATHAAVAAIGRDRAWALTGTPIENSPRDLASLLNFVEPGVVESDAPSGDLAHAASEYVLRRTKDQVLRDLPPKMCFDEPIELSGPQAESYRQAEERGVLRLTEMGDEATIQHVFELVLRLKQICNFDPATGASGKADRLVADLEEIAASGRKAIVFSQWVDTLRELKRRLAAYRPLEFHGRVSQSRRGAVLQQFRDDDRSAVLLMSYGAGGVGLNLQFCEYVFLFDRWWNPAVEDQAINRAHRIGAVGPVTVTRFLTPDTIEERIDQVLETKRRLFDEVFDAAGAPTSGGLTHEEIFGLFHLDQGGGARAAA